MIRYDQTNRSFHLQGPSYSYILGVYDGVLMHMYWGKKLPEGNHAELFVLPGEAASFDPPFNR